MQAEEKMYRQYAEYVFKYLLSLTGSRDMAEEITQETFYQAVKSIHKFDGSCKLSTWLCAIAKNQLAAYRRKNPETASLESPESLSLAAESSEEIALRNRERTLLYKRLHACPEPYRELLYLRLFSDLSFREIGDIMGKSESWARVTFYRWKEMLKKEMEKDG
ncbi:MAG: sigma-70 family RNA polymerase sigma factor [Firmicutes bacterium]|nr:sigma-70 family RNA polymerase sigma factor [Bacillota bacterium]